MTAADALAIASWSLHGIRLEATASHPEALQALSLRFRAFDRGFSGGQRGMISFEFLPSRPQRPSVADRPVYDTPHGTLFYDPNGDRLHGRFGGVQLDCEPAEGVARIDGGTFSGTELYLATHPLTTIALMELLERRGLHALHAGCVAHPDGTGLLLAGPSGAGKSTLALALARGGMTFLSDDTVFLECAAERVRVLGFADTIGLTRYAAERFPELRPLLDEAPRDGFPKRLHRIEDMFGSRPGLMCEPRSLVFPTVAPGEKSALAPLDAGDALLRLVPDVLLTDPESTQEHLKAISAMLATVRCYELRSGTDLERAADLARDTLRN